MNTPQLLAGSPGHRAALSHFVPVARLSSADRREFERRVEKGRRFPPGHELIVAGEEYNAPQFLLSGWAAQAVYLRDGRRQIIDYYIPGDLIGYSSRTGARAMATYVALTQVDVACASDFLDYCRETMSTRRIADSLQELEQAYEYRLLRQIVRNGRQSALERIASLLYEFYCRMERSGQAVERRFPFPITQEMLADGLGLSVVHVNRTLQQLRRANLIATDGTSLEIRNADHLASLAQAGG
jgi:CRP-like cAMP-binding protein